MANESHLLDRAAAVDKDLGSLASGMTARQTLTLVVGFGLLAAIAGFYWYGYSIAKPLLEPKTMVDAASGLAMENLPTVRKEVVAYAKDNLPGLAAFASKSAMDNLPMAREHLEGMLLAGADKQLADARDPLRATLQQLVRKNKKLLAEGATELTKSPEAADKFLKNVAEAAEKDLGADMDKTVGTMAGAIEGFGDTLRTAGVETRRSSLQVMLREILMLAKRLSLEMHEAMPADAKAQIKDAAKEFGGNSK